MIQMTIRKLPEALQERLRSEAGRRGTSLNKTVIRLLMKAVGLTSGVVPKRDLSGLAGRWTATQAEEFDRAVERFEVIDGEIWR